MLDVIAYQELSSYGSTDNSDMNNESSSLQNLVSNFEHDYALVWDRENNQDIGISSKYELEFLKGDNTYEGYAIFKIKDENYVFILIHLDSGSKNKRKKETDLILADYQIYRDAGNHVILLGDYNSVSELDNE